MGFKKGNQNIDSVFYGTDYVERMYLGGEQFFQASYLDFYKTNLFSIGLGKKQIDNPKGDGAISYIKTEWSSQYGYQLEVNQPSAGRSTNYTDTVFRDNFSFILPKGKYLVNAALKNMPTSTGELYCRLLKKGETPNQDAYLTTSTFSDGLAKEVSVDEDTEVYLGVYIKDLNVGKTTIFSLELYPAEGVSGKFVEKPSLMARGRKKKIYNSSVSSIDITIPEKAFYSGEEYPVEYIDSDAFNYEVTENGATVSQPLTKISTITVEGNNMIGFGNRAFKNCSSCTSFSCTSRVFLGGLSTNNAAFEGCEALNSLTLSIVKNINGLKESQTLKSINMGGRNTYSFDDSFAGNTSIEKIHWKNKDEPSGIEKPFTAHFGISSFEGCKNLKTIVSNDYDVAEGTLGKDTVFIVDDAAFAYCTSLDTKGAGFGPNTGPLYSRLAYRAFFECTGLTSIDFGTKEGVETAIGSLAFENCTGLTSINLPNTVTSIWSKAFSGCSSLVSINIPFIGESATSTNNKFSYIFGTVPTSLTTVGFSEGNNITKIPDYAFQVCSGLTSITIPDSVTSIDVGAFYGCSGLTSITIPVGVTSIGNSAFQGCSGLTSITIPNSVTSIGITAFIDCRSLKSINIPNGVTSIGNGTFYGCSGLTSVNIPNSVTSIGVTAFYGCSSLTSVTIPDSVTSIGDGAFQDCSSLKSIIIPNSVTSIGRGAFEGCSSLETINIPFIGESATSTNNKFSYIFGTVPTSLKTVGFSEGNNITKIPDYAFQGCSNITSINGNDTGNIVSIGAYGYAETGITSMKLSSALISIGEYAFYYCKGLTSITIPSGVTSIGSHTFAGCSGLTSITIPDSVTSIGSGAFDGCSGLTSITIPNSVTSIRSSAFASCSGLTSITIPNSVTNIDRSTFANCSGLTSITIPNSVTNIDDSAFDGCSSLTSITIPNSVTSIGDNTFKGCSSLKSITIPNGVTSIGDGAFYGCSGLTSVNIPNSVTSIGTQVFDGCSSLKSITIPYGVKSIGWEAFDGCSSLTSINIPSSVTSIDWYAFRGCSSLKSITIPNSVTGIGAYAFRGCSSLTIYAKAATKPDGWDRNWNPDNRPVVWGYKG